MAKVNKLGQLGLLWFDNSQKDWFSKLDAGINGFYEKMGCNPTEIRLNPADFDSLSDFAKKTLVVVPSNPFGDTVESPATEEDMFPKIQVYKGIEVISDQHILPYHFLLF